jgi:hypothetical protein
MLAAAAVEQMELALKAMVELVAVAMLEQRERLALPILEAVVVAAQLVVVIQVAAVLSSSKCHRLPMLHSHPA